MPFTTIAVAFAMLVSPIVSSGSIPVRQDALNSVTSKETVLSVSRDASVIAVPLADQNNKIVIEEAVRDFYEETPILAEIAFCESTFRHLDKNGNVVRGKVDKGDTGVMQINERYHREDAKKLGYDIDTLEGNLQYAKWLYENQGTVPWNSSKPCWGQYQ